MLIGRIHGPRRTTAGTLTWNELSKIFAFTVLDSCNHRARMVFCQCGVCRSLRLPAVLDKPSSVSSPAALLASLNGKAPESFTGNRGFFLLSIRCPCQIAASSGH